LGKPVRLNDEEKGAQTAWVNLTADDADQTDLKRSGDRGVARDRVIGKTETLPLITRIKRIFADQKNSLVSTKRRIQGLRPETGRKIHVLD
jgi:hypothetical protein